MNHPTAQNVLAGIARTVQFLQTLPSETLAQHWNELVHVDDLLDAIAINHNVLAFEPPPSDN